MTRSSLPRRVVRRLLRSVRGPVEESDIAVVRLPPAVANRTTEILMRRAGDRDQVARALHHLGWEGFEPPLPSAVVAIMRRWPGTLLDVGANTGLYSLLATAAEPRAAAIAFEPVPEIQAALRHNIGLNGLDERIVIDDVAISDRSGTATLHLPPPQPDGTIETSASLEPDFKEQIERRFEVRTSTLDDAWEAHGRPDVTMVKIDVEGSEARVLAGARRLIEACSPVISVEVLAHLDPAATEHERAACGYVDLSLAPALVRVRPGVEADPTAPNHLLVPPDRLRAVLDDLRAIPGLIVDSSE